VVADLAAPVDAKQGRRGGRIEAQEGLTGAAAQGVTGFVLHKQHGIGAERIGQKPTLELLLPGPGAAKRHRLGHLETDSFEFGFAHQPFLALDDPQLLEALG
jgi:hypothetical protein